MAVTTAAEAAEAAKIRTMNIPHSNIIIPFTDISWYNWNATTDKTKQFQSKRAIK